MRVAVVTPYFQESDEVLEQCLESVAAQTHPVTHILVADGFPRDWAARPPARHITLPGSGHGDNGNRGRAVGAAAAVAENFDAIALLDADNWFRPDHIASPVALYQQTGAAICTSARSLHRMDGSLLAEHDGHSNGVDFSDTSCLLYMAAAFSLLPLWEQMQARFSPICDRIMWSAIQSRKFSTAHSGMPTMAFRTCYCVHYRGPGEIAPPGCKGQEEIDQVISLWNALPEPERARILLRR
jgi:glycosyltransferase involved in cell wall biosynthesis